MIRNFLPYCMFKVLFGDRNNCSVKDKTYFSDKDFIRFKENWETFYNDNQKSNIGKFIDYFGYRITKHVDFSNKTVLEVGPGIIGHLSFFKSKPSKYIIADIYENNLEISKKILNQKGISNVKKIKLERDKLSRIKKNSIDIVLSFNHLEHIVDLDEYLKSLSAVLKPGGLLIGSVPTEGGLLWGIGRYFTSRRYAYKKMMIDYDKLICFEHPNYVDQIENALERDFDLVFKSKSPFGKLFGFDFNFSYCFICKNR